MTLNGFYNEIDFIKMLDSKHVYELDKVYFKALEKIYGGNIRKKSFVRAYKSFKSDKDDIVIIVDDVFKYVSIKSGKNNSVHLEPISEFIKFLKDCSFLEKEIQIYLDYHYATVDGKRLSAKEYQIIKKDEIEIFNKIVNRKDVLIKAIKRFLFTGIYSYNHSVDAIIYGTISDFICLSKDEIFSYLLNQTDSFSSIHFSSLTLQPWTRNLNYNAKYEYRRDYVQVKWYRLEEVFKNIIKS